MSAEFDQLVAQFEQFQSKLKHVEEPFADLGGMQAELAELEATASSPDRAVTVVAGVGGSIKEIRFADNPGLGAVVMATLQRAVAEAARKQAVIVDEHTNGALDLVDQVLEVQAEALGTTVDELKSNLRDEAPAAPPRSDDFSEQTVLRRADDTPQPPPYSGGSGSAGDSFLKNLFDEEDH
ncbi:YbaB/EbfC family nucleoid-associated protein [Amycolatopsis sp. cg5]|uniref:YbaB/EbfC family nucleoid-associated protein n=1 Tax=Amycolatopsis sp. cg5 TaxID=3238802 RepID=UPI003523F2C0